MRTIYHLILTFTILSAVNSFGQVDSIHQASMFAGHPNRIKQLDSLIQNASNLALNTTDYQQELKTAFETGQNTDSLLSSVAVRFFTHLAYGNNPPKLEFNGAKFKMDAFDVPLLVKKYVERDAMNALVQYFTKSSKEVGLILDSLKMNQRKAKPNLEKIQILQKAANEYRWLTAIRKTNRFILVNIPSAQLKAYDSNKLILSMRVIVGKAKTQTNTLSSQINKVVLNPYWMVPKSIIQNEMFAKFKEDKNYFTKNGFTVINSEYVNVDPITIDIKKYSKDNFPFIVRQGTGFDNSLG